MDPEITTDSSTEFDEIKPYANPCCYELIQKCTGRHFACACEQQYFKCKCGWKNIGKEKGAYQCEQRKDIVANCVSCGSFQIKKKGKFLTAKTATVSSRKSYTDHQLFKFDLFVLFIIVFKFIPCILAFLFVSCVHNFLYCWLFAQCPFI